VTTDYRMIYESHRSTPRSTR